MNKLLRDIWVIGRFEARRSIGSLRGTLVLALYLAASAMSGISFVKLAQAYDGGSPQEMVQVAPVARATMPTSAGSSLRYGILMQLLAGGDNAKADLWARTPAIVLVHFWLSLFFLPVILMASAHDVLARDTEQGTLRYVRPRTSILAWVAGKFAAQAALASIAILASGLLLYGIAVDCLGNFDPIAGGIAFASFWWRIPIYGLGILGVLFVVSAGARTPFTALLTSGLAFFVLWLIKTSGLLRYASPFAFESGLWQPYGIGLGSSVLAYLSFALAGIGISVAWLARRDT